MARYMALSRSFLPTVGHLGPRLVEAGEEIEYDGEPGSSLHPLDDEARERVARLLLSAYDKRQAARGRAGLTRSQAAIIAKADRRASEESKHDRDRGQ